MPRILEDIELAKGQKVGKMGVRFYGEFQGYAFYPPEMLNPQNKPIGLLVYKNMQGNVCNNENAYYNELINIRPSWRCLGWKQCKGNEKLSDME